MTIRNVIRSLAIAPIRGYQKYISPAFAPSCRYAPTCSNYAIEAIREHGAIKGIILGTWRILRCNPWSKGGVDHVPPRGRWKPDPWVPPGDWVGHTLGQTPPSAMGYDGETTPRPDEGATTQNPHRR